MKCEVTYKCGHTKTIDFKCARCEVQKKLDYYGMNLCSACQKEYELEILKEKCDILDINYSDYCHFYRDCKTIKGSYDPNSKTIKVLVPKNDKKIRNSDGYKEVKVPYSLYKYDYREYYASKPDSYDPESKTIVMYVSPDDFDSVQHRIKDL